MLRKVMKWILYVLLLVTVMLAGYYLKVYLSVQSRMNKKYEVVLQPFFLRKDSAALAEGARLVKAKGCIDCHGESLSGAVWLDDPMLGKVVAPNLTKGEGGLPADYSDEDWLRALKHGLRKDSTPLWIMPAHETTLLNEEDMNAIIAYCSTLEPIDHTVPPMELRMLGYILTDLGKIPLLPAEMIDHTRKLTKGVKKEVSIEFGKYLALGCEGCHKKDLRGGAPIAPGMPPVANITTSGNPGKWTEDEFMRTLRTGETPEGKKLDPKAMPWLATRNFTDTEMKALYRYLQTLK